MHEIIRHTPGAALSRVKPTSAPRARHLAVATLRSSRHLQRVRKDTRELQPPVRFFSSKRALSFVPVNRSGCTEGSASSPSQGSRRTGRVAISPAVPRGGTAIFVRRKRNQPRRQDRQAPPAAARRFSLVQCCCCSVLFHDCACPLIDSN
ncbi:hypothetical protein MRX96_037658 [Rhipicephalus microplus]